MQGGKVRILELLFSFHTDGIHNLIPRSGHGQVKVQQIFLDGQVGNLV